jgi:hypothetical protein
VDFISQKTKRNWKRKKKETITICATSKKWQLATDCSITKVDYNLCVLMLKEEGERKRKFGRRFRA